MSSYTEDVLVQQTMAEYLEQQLGWQSVYAYNNEDFGPDSLLGRTSDREVVLTRSLTPIDEGDVSFDQGIPIPVALAVWDGSQPDAAAMKMVSSWHWIIIGASPDGQ